MAGSQISIAEHADHAFDGKRQGGRSDDFSGRQVCGLDRPRRREGKPLGKAGCNWNGCTGFAAGGTPFNGLKFSPDGNYLYFVRTDKQTFNYSYLYKMASLGGASTQLVKDVDTGVTFSPDEKQIAYVRGVPNAGVWKLMIASADGSGERQLAALPSTINFLSVATPAWSPDGKSIALSLLESAGGQHPVLKIITVADGSSRTLYSPGPGSSSGRRSGCRMEVAFCWPCAPAHLGRADRFGTSVIRAGKCADSRMTPPTIPPAVSG